MGFTDAVSTCFAKYATFEGRASRAEYWYWLLFTIVMDVVAFLVASLLPGDLAGMFLTAVVIALLVPDLSVSVRRLHDMNHSGWWMLISLTALGASVLLVWSCFEGTRGDNRFGPRPS